MVRKVLATSLVASAVALGTNAATAAGEVEVLHWWTSGGEAAALNVLKEDLESKGVTWQDMPVAGGGGTEAMTALRARVTAGNAPTAVQMLGFDILDWAKEGALGNLNAVAGEEGWDDVVPHRAAGIRQARRQLDLRAGERPLHQLGVDQQGRARRGRRQGAGELGGPRRRPRTR